jgi:uncharacterized protein (DUF1330 family)
MTAYVITDIKVRDSAQYQEQYKGYMALSPEAVRAAGGEFIVRGGAHEVLEGDWQPNRLVMLRFSSYEAARAFYDSTLYRQARAKRAGATEFFNMVVVKGADEK